MVHGICLAHREVDKMGFHFVRIWFWCQRSNWNNQQGCGWLSRIPSSSELDIIGACWHGETNLEIILGWHVVSFLCILANNCWKVSCQAQVDSSSTFGNSKVEPNDIGLLDFFGNVQVLTYIY